MRWIAMVVVTACSSEAPKPASPPPVIVPPVVDAAPVVAIDAAPPIVEDDDDPFRGRGKVEQTWKGPIPPKPAVVPMAPGIHPILVVADTGDDFEEKKPVGPPEYFVLGCAKVEKGKPTVFLGSAKCLPLIQNVQLEVVLEKSRAPVRIVGKGRGGLACKFVTDTKVPTVKIAGVPKEGGSYIVSKGMAQYEGPVDADSLKAIRKVRPLSMTKRPNVYGPYPEAQFDLDGDGTFEVIMSMEGMTTELFTADGILLGSLGCYLG